MTELNISKTTVLERHEGSNAFSNAEYETASQALEYSENDEVYIDFPNAAKYWGYYKKYGQLKKAIDTLSLYTVGKGYATEPYYKVIMDNWRGIGEDTAVSIFWNMEVTKYTQGDAFAEIIRDEKSNRILNVKPISPERMRVVYGKNGIIKRFEQVKNGKVDVKFKPEEIFHISNDRVGDEQRGVSVVECCEWVINAIEEARRDYRVLLHRNVVPVRIIEVDTDDTTKRNAFMTEYKDAIQKGEVLVVPKGTVSISDTKIQIQDPIQWIQSLENYFYLAVGIPKTIASPEGVSEGTSKVGYLLFEPIYTYRQTLLEADIWAQLQIRLTFNRPPSLMDNMQSNEAKNTSQTGFQPKDTQVTGGNE